MDQGFENKVVRTSFCENTQSNDVYEKEYNAAETAKHFKNIQQLPEPDIGQKR